MIIALYDGVGNWASADPDSQLIIPVEKTNNTPSIPNVASKRHKGTRPKFWYKKKSYSLLCLHM